MLKKSLFSPAHPWCAETHLITKLRSRIVQILNGDPAASPLGGAHNLGAPYSSHRAPQRLRLRSSLAAALPGELFEHPGGLLPLSLKGGHRNSRASTRLFRSFLDGVEIGLARYSEVVANADGEGEDTVGRAKSEWVSVRIAMV